jgi:hypothetical protein
MRAVVMSRSVRFPLLFAGLWVGWFGAVPAQAAAGLLSSYSADVTFTDPLTASVTMSIAFDGTSYWSSTGNSTDGVRYAQIGSNGVTVQTYSPGLDFRSVFVNPNSRETVYARAYSDGKIYQQTSAGVFTATSVSLSGLDSQSSVVFNGAGTEFLAMNNGVVSRFNLSGSLLGTVNLSGWGSNSEGNYPQNRGIAAAGDYWFTYTGVGTGGGTLSVWDTSGNRIGSTVLLGAGNTFASNFSLSLANGRIFVIDDTAGTWRGYKIGDFSAIPEPGTWALLGAGSAVVGLLRWRRRPRA